MSDDEATVASAGFGSQKSEPTTEYRSPLPRLTRRVFRDLAIWMTGLGLLMGVAFPFFVVALGVPSRYALTPSFFVATTLAGLSVGVANHYLSSSVVGSRLRFMRSKMSTVEEILSQSAFSDAIDDCTPEKCSILVDSDDELGEVLSSFNRLVAAQAGSRRSTSAGLPVCIRPVVSHRADSSDRRIARRAGICWSVLGIGPLHCSRRRADDDRIEWHRRCDGVGDGRVGHSGVPHARGRRDGPAG